MRITGKLGSAIALATIMTTGAVAADLYVPATPVFVDEDTSTSNFYIGLHKGYGWGLADHTSLDPGNDIDLTGWLLGIHAGVLFQTNSNIVFGLEKDIEWTNIAGECESPDCSAFADPYYASINFEGSARARIGFMTDGGMVMPYLTGGLAWANATRGSDVDEETLYIFGWTAGAGIEVMTDSNMSFFGEARYTSYTGAEFDTGGTPPTVAFSHTTIRFGANWYIN
ncbi:MAG TPA: outer membrane beta-barrel protein [Hyphomicrobiaceae bacterium]|nr:outer membrane beta-barrel protein [Hyphomicrobiaceae bacterium]